MNSRQRRKIEAEEFNEKKDLYDKLFDVVDRSGNKDNLLKLRIWEHNMTKADIQNALEALS